MECNKARIMPVIWRSSLVLLPFMLPQNAIAQQVYKCVSGNQVSYQSAPCASGKAAKAWDAAPVAEPTNAELWRRYRIQQQLDRRYAADRAAAARRSYSSGVIQSDPQSLGCTAAKASRSAAYNAAGLKRTFALSRAMDDAVYDACK